MKPLSSACTVICLLFMTGKTLSQDLDPRAYVRAPVTTSFIGLGFGYSEGGVITDPTLPIKDVHAVLESPSLAAGRIISMFGQTAQISAAVPYVWGEATGSLQDSAQRIRREGFGDLRMRVSLLVLGAPSATAFQLAQAQRKTVLGVSLAVIAPTGQYFSDKLINLGTHRWAFKPEVGLSQPIGKRWLFDLYAGLWLFTQNNSYYTGNSVRTQDPMGSFQTHISYNFSPRTWAAFDLTYYTGGASSIDGNKKDDRQDNSRIGGTFVLPVGKRNSVKAAYSTGAIIRSGANFSTLSIGWQFHFLGKRGMGKPESPN